MWTYKCESTNSDNIHKISIFSKNSHVTYAEIIKLWQKDNGFRTFFNSLLADSPFEAYFWETPPITKSTVNQQFEFILIDSKQLTKVHANANSFKQYFNSREIVTFANLGNDALLVVPCPTADVSTYPHLASFVRHAPKSQQHLLWQTVGKKVEQSIDLQPLWVSTAGLGVHWLHVRLDSYPKYYKFKPYRAIEVKN